MSRTFPITPPPAHAAWLLGALLLVPLVVIALTFTTADADAKAPAAMGIGIAIVALVGMVTFLGLRRRQVLLDDGRLVVKAAMFTHRLDVSALDLARARIVDLDERTELRPGLKSFGMSLPGFQAGWFLLRDRSRGFCLVTSRRRVLWLPAHAGSSLLLSLEQPQAMLDALRTVAGTATGHRA